MGVRGLEAEPWPNFLLSSAGESGPAGRVARARASQARGPRRDGARAPELLTRSSKGVDLLMA
jgi:hypothetical protein